MSKQENKQPKIKRRAGDRFDGTLVKEMSSMSKIMPMIYPNRCDNEAFIQEKIDMGPIRDYVAKKNAEEGMSFQYTPFHVIVAATIKLLVLRPKLNRFIANRLVYERRWISAAFVVKKLYADDGDEALAIIYGDKDDTMSKIHEKLFEQISVNKDANHVDSSTESMDAFSKIPVRLLRPVVRFIGFLEKHGKCPRSFIETDPFYSSVLLSNVGSYKLSSAYHHLTNWGTTSLFLLIGEMKDRPFINEKGKTDLKETVSLGITIDERLADGYYYAKSIRMLKAILANPEILDEPFGKEVEI